MNIEERVAFFQEMICCNYPVHLWQYNNQMELLYSNCPEEFLASDMVSLMNFSATLFSYLEKGNRNPMILSTNFGLLWLTAFEFRDAALYRIHIIGPAFSGRDSHLIIKKKLDSYSISVQLRSQIFRQLDSVPIIPTSTLLHCAVMLHFAVTGEKLSAKQVAFTANEEDTDSKEDDIRLISEEHRGVWLYEQAFLKKIQEGSADYRQAMEKMMSLSSGVKSDVSDSLRQAKNNVLVLLTLCSRAAIEGGLNPSIAYSLNDYYATLLEQKRNMAEVNQVSEQMLEDYVARIRQARANTTCSPQIQDALDYISLHVKETITIPELAGRAGYTEYYFSHKFKQQTGLSVSEYIRQRKLEEARLLLSGTHLGVQEISDELSFGSRNYFYSCFLKYTGMSPSEYREKYARS